MLPMGVTSENVAARFNVDRAAQDAFAVASHQKAAAARAAGKFKAEIVPVHTKVGGGGAAARAWAAHARAEGGGRRGGAKGCCVGGEGAVVMCVRARTWACTHART